MQAKLNFLIQNEELKIVVSVSQFGKDRTWECSSGSTIMVSPSRLQLAVLKDILDDFLEKSR